MATLQLQFSGGGQLAGTRASLRAIENATPGDILGQLNRSLHEIERRQFSTFGVFGARDGSVPWAPLSPRYAAWKAVHFPGMPLLRREDILYRAASVLSSAVAVHDTVLVTIPDRKAEWHQHGTIGRVGRHGHTGSLPPRPVLPVGSVDRIWTGHWKRYLKGLAEAADHDLPPALGRLAGGSPLADF